jgi:hypothetical protein
VDTSYYVTLGGVRQYVDIRGASSWCGRAPCFLRNSAGSRSVRTVALVRSRSRVLGRF